MESMAYLGEHILFCRINDSRMLTHVHSVGPTDLTTGTVSNTGMVPTVTDNLHSQGTISSEILGVYFEPETTASSDLTGELTFGGVDTSKTTGNVNYVPITGTSPASLYWGIDQSLSYGGSTILHTTAGIVDTGTTLVLIATGTQLAHTH
jgi:saccharopepsin